MNVFRTTIGIYNMIINQNVFFKSYSYQLFIKSSTRTRLHRTPRIFIVLLRIVNFILNHRGRYNNISAHGTHGSDKVKGICS